MDKNREKMIELLLSGDKTVQCEHSPEVNCDGTKCAFCERVEIADRLIANGVAFATDTNDGSKWISVEDEMPHAEYGESDNVLTVDGLGIVEMLYFDGGCWCYPTGEPVFYEDPSWRITHWMPMPEPPVMQEVPNGTDHV